MINTTQQTIDQRAMLIRLSISQWTARKFDKQATYTTIAHYSAAKDSGRFSKVLVELAEIKKIARIVNDARTYHYAITLPWGDDNSRILPSPLFLKYSAKMRQLETDFQSQVDDFANQYSTLIANAQNTLGGLFNSRDYPHPGQIKKYYKFKFDILPIQTAADFRVNLDKSSVETIQKGIEDQMKQNIEAAVSETWKRLHSAIQHMSEKLGEKDAVFRDSLVGNIKELTDILPDLNITNDPALAETIETARQELTKLNPDSLRRNPQEREEAKKKADDILSKMSGFTGKKQ